MNILHISRRFHPFKGGTEKYIYDLSKYQVRAGHACKVLTINRDIIDGTAASLAARETIDGIGVVRVRAIGSKRKPVPLEPWTLWHEFSWAQVVHLHDMRFCYETAWILRPLMRYRLVLSTHGLIFHTTWQRQLKEWLFRYYYLPTLNMFDVVIAVSKRDHRFLLGRGLKNVSLVENGIDFSQYAGIQQDPGPGSLVCFGRIDDNKGLEDLFACLALVRGSEWTLTIAGTGRPDHIGALHELAARSGISNKIRWAGRVSDDALSDLVRTAQLCVFPSRYEGFGYTLLEAMASGVVVLANRIPAYEDLVIDGENGYLVDFQDPKAGARRISELLRRNAQSRDVGPNARAAARQYDWTTKVESIMALYSGKGDTRQ